MLSYFKTYLFKNSTEPRTKEEEKSKGIQTTTITPIQPTTQPTVNPEIQSQLMKAILDGSIEGAKKAISAGADINNVESDGKTPLWQALLLGKFGIVNALLESGAKTDIPYKGKSVAQAVVDVFNNMQGSYRSTNTDPLILKTMSSLVAKGVDFAGVKILNNGSKVPTIADMIQKNGLEIIRSSQIRADFFELIQQLKLHGYDKIIDKIWNNGSYEWDKNVITFCLKNGIDINQNITTEVRNLSPMPALFFAIWMNNNSKVANDGIENLLNAGADINLKANPDGKDMQTPLDYAESLGKTGAIRILMQRGAKTSSELK